MPTPTRQLLASTFHLTDGTTTIWNFSFSGGYIDKGHIKAYYETPAGIRTIITVTKAMVVGAYQLQITPVIASGNTLVIYRDTPKTAPLVDFTDESGLSEIALDTTAKQAVFIGAEAFDNSSVTIEAQQAASNAEASSTQAGLYAAQASGFASASALSADTATVAVQNAQAIYGGQPAGLRNRIINGNFDVWQRNTSFVSGVAGQYGPDRWQVFRSGNAAGASFSQIVYGGNFEAGSTFALRMQRNNGDTSTASIQATTSFETIDVYKLRGKTVTLSFWSIRGANFSGTSGGVAIYYGTGTDGNMFTGFTGAVHLGSVVLNIAGFTKYSVTVVVPSNASQLGVVMGYTPIGTAGAADYMEITGIQLELGSVATPFEQRPYGLELVLCQRYYEVGSAFPVGYVVSGFNMGALCKFAVPKRVAPTVIQTNTGASNVSTSTSAANGPVATEGYLSYRVGTATGVGQYTEIWTASAEL